ncbi:MAG: CvpA family protein [Candidatus Omnitrophica bacterium]|nr:CvpA family protein [Candidatus Omnitrophota bacterium]MBU4149941.1 CvpA family protein [Candidatus Omnitrophota bacterium]
MSLTKFGWVDILFITLLIRICYIGFKNGLLPEFFRLLGLFSAFVLSFNNYTLAGRFLTTYTKWNGVNLEIISFLVIFSATLFIFKLIAIAAGLLSSRENVSLSSKIIGLAFGFCRGVLLVSLIYILFVNSQIKYLSRSANEKSMLSRYIAGIVPAAYDIGINLYPLPRIDTPLAQMLKK